MLKIHVIALALSLQWTNNRTFFFRLIYWTDSQRVQDQNSSKRTEFDEELFIIR